MAIISLQQISKQYDYSPILTDISLHVNAGERIAIIGCNGSGKSTLLKIITGEITCDSGQVSVAPLDIQSLPQKPDFENGLSVREAIESRLHIFKKLKEEFELLNEQIAKGKENTEIWKRQQEIIQFLDDHNAWDLDNQLDQILQAFKLKHYENEQVCLLSGGEQKRVALAAILLQKPDILLLDEPTNHLDVQMVEFLEELILKEKYTLLFISHDRYFIDSLATRCVEIDSGTLRSFEGGYQKYLGAKEALLSSMSKEYEVLLKHLKEEEEWLRRGVQARRKRNEGRKQRLLELREEAKKNPSLIRKMRLELEREQKHFNQSEGVNRQKMLFELECISLKINEKNLIKDLNLRILQKDRIAVVGRNGSGKSSFLKMLLGEISATQGVLQRGLDLRIGYFDQQKQGLDDSKSLIETFCPFGGDRVFVRGKNMHVYGYLKNFLFPKEFLDKKIGVLSGGEKSRIALALLFTKEYDCLILDEPTNDLDIQTINILEEYLQSFQGALLIVSHDRYFVDKIAKKLLVFDGYGDVIQTSHCFSEFLEREKEIFYYEELEKTQNDSKTQRSQKNITKLSYKENRLLESLPREIEEIQKRRKEIEPLLYNPPSNEELILLSQEYEHLNKEEEEKLDLYITLEEKRESLLKNKE
ncbi:ABC transporter ATP-binding protein [Helicobacter monodelphidis]|uniref:ribosomal protection-like ABC-F family protein n=1 Tax=Helicobacter sp. 15-1451 TaxID=2004995 RepID=UPI000DCF4112|nr:ABC-F family ATP-binding cassette domain-containing protein [Helicobacter sp. 15-1451]RAX57511.1 ABC transporter ATP-binding protein [Helicobacter sp. 15-1451]